MSAAHDPLLAALNNLCWNEKFASWHRPASDAEEERIQRAARMVREVVRADPNIAPHNVEVIPQGSYLNNTNVRLHSDMDLCVRYGYRFMYYIPPEVSLTAADLEIIPLAAGTAEATARWLKATLYEGLKFKFGAHNVERGNKALKVHGVEGSRVDGDVIPALGYWLATKSGLLGIPYVEKGTAIYTDDGRWIYNFPEQHHERGKAKNERTGRRYKRAVRVLKRLAGELGLLNPPPSFLIESLTYNCPDALFAADDWHETISRILTWMEIAIEQPSGAAQLVEANGIKPLFAQDQPWTLGQANAFARSALLKIS